MAMLAIVFVGSGAVALEQQAMGAPMVSKISKSNYDITPLSRERVAELAKKLDPEAFRITQSAATERPFCGTLLDNKKDGVYACVVCGLPLFSSEHKFNSGTGWPSFYREFDPEHVAKHVDRSMGMARTEINCARCGAHLGHVFDDGPAPTGQRHCLNSASLTFVENGQTMPAESRPVLTSTAGKENVQMASMSGNSGQAAGAQSAAAQDAAAQTNGAQTETAYFAGGCFWGIEHYFQQGPGVIDAESGYMQGNVENPTYKQVCTDTTGHAETVKVVFDPKKMSYRRLLQAFFDMHDPTELNRQGPDVGNQYRSGIWTTSDAQKREAEAYIKELTDKKAFGGKKIVTQVEPAKKFWPAEEYHQDYVETTGRACHVADPW
jgi:peptide methionine sulfoxide reductase msrA/msrB